MIAEPMPDDSKLARVGEPGLAGHALDFADAALAEGARR